MTRVLLLEAEGISSGPFKAEERTPTLLSTSWMSLPSWIRGMGLLLHPQQDSWCLAAGKNEVWKVFSLFFASGYFLINILYYLYFPSECGKFCGCSV